MAKIKCSKCAFLNDETAARCRQCGEALPSISFEAKAAAPKDRPAPEQQSHLNFKRGQVINGRYTVLDMIGRGGMGCIYKVHDNVLGEDLALKTLLPQFVTEKAVIDRFLNEARITRKLTHPNIVRVHDIGTTGKGIFISMEYVMGDSLRGMLEKNTVGKRLPVRQVLHIIDQLCLALDYAHQYTVHRDIKPENIMITESNQIKLMDFGISKLMDNKFMTSASVVMGTPFYMSPEQYRNTRDVDARADIYSVGIVMYEMLTGHMPTGIPKPASQMLKEIPPALDEILVRCIDPDREKRFKTAGELRAAIQPIITMLDEGKDPQKTLARKRLPRQDGQGTSLHTLVAGVIALLVIVATGAGLYFLEKNYSAVGSADALVDGRPASGQTGRLAELEYLVNQLRPVLDAMDDMGARQRQWLERGEDLWKQVPAATQEGSQNAIALAESALQHFLAIYLNPEGMVFVPAGQVDIDGVNIFEPGFFIDANEVTAAQFAAFCREVPGGWRMPPELQQPPDHPASYIAWFDAQAYAAWKGKHLPSRRQWERAAHGDPDAPGLYPWGTEWKSGAANMQTGSSQPVRSFGEDVVWSGCFDMAGNVAEWTSTLATGSVEQAAAFFGDYLYICGGSFLRVQPLNKPEKQAFEFRSPDLGFRCVLPVPTNREQVEALLQH